MHKTCCIECYNKGRGEVLEGMITRASKKDSVTNRIRLALYNHPDGILVEDISKIVGKRELIVWTRLYELARKGEADHDKDFWRFI